MKTVLTAFFQLRPYEDLDWVLYILVISMVLIVLGRLLFSNNFESLRSLDRFMTVNDNQNLFGLLFQTVYVFLIALLVYQFLPVDYDFVFYSPVFKIVVAAALILLFFSVRTLLSATGTYAFGISPDADLKLRIFSYYRVFGVAILWTGVLLFYFTAINPYILLVIIGFMLLSVRVISYSVYFKNRPNKETKFWYYYILYLCTLEILPLLVLLKFLID